MAWGRADFPFPIRSFYAVTREVTMAKRVKKPKAKQRLMKIRDLTPKEGTPIKGGVANPLFERYDRQRPT
jgi:hypothetical protein